MDFGCIAKSLGIENPFDGLAPVGNFLNFVDGQNHWQCLLLLHEGGGIELVFDPGSIVLYTIGDGVDAFPMGLLKQLLHEGGLPYLTRTRNHLNEFCFR